MPLALLTFLSGIAISAVAIYYSVLGLASIFSAAALPIIVMGTILELSKLVSAWWLKANWHRAPRLLKSYMLIAVIVLMLITSMGIFGFLSKAHSDQAVPAGDAAASMQIIDEKISIQQEYITQARKDIEVLNTQIDRYNELGAVSKGVRVRDQQKAERDQLLNQIETSQTAITKLREQRAPVAASVRAIEAEVGPIKYIAAFVYGDNPNANILEKAVTWVIITIVFVFDPLAILLLLASQMSFQWARESKEQITPVPTFENTEAPAQEEIVEPAYEQDDGPITDEQIKQIKESTVVSIVNDYSKLEQEPIVADIRKVREEEFEKIEAQETTADAKRVWKEAHPLETLKEQKEKFLNGEIDELPWITYANQKKYIMKEDNQQVTKETEGYKQNAEQSDNTIWTKLKRPNE
jgi:hypothetical protein